MSVGHYHGLCNQYRGRAVEIKTRDGGCYRGIISHVDNNKVFIQPLRRRPRNLGGFGYGYYRRPRYRYGYGGFGIGLALGSIATLALLPFFYW